MEKKSGYLEVPKKMKMKIWLQSFHLRNPLNECEWIEMTGDIERERERNNTHRIGVVGGGGGGGVYDRPILSIFEEEKMIFFSLLMSRCTSSVFF